MEIAYFMEIAYVMEVGDSLCHGDSLYHGGRFVTYLDAITSLVSLILIPL